MRARSRVCLAAIAAVCIAGTARAETIRLGAIIPLTGPGAVVGTQEERGIQFAIDAANAKGGVGGNKIEVLYEDNQAKPDQSILSFNKLVDLQHVPLIFTGYSGPTLAMAPLATRKKVLMLNAGAQSDKLTNRLPLPRQHAALDRRRGDGAQQMAHRAGQEDRIRVVRERRRGDRRA